MGWRAYTTSCAPYTVRRSAQNTFRSYQRYVTPSYRDRTRYRRLPGAW